ncbi:hypothetical protein M413DRAFT_27285 [Hebeloma cylindrosporum]|uniref:Uncharacterized protein n=1 Tax=Hebeloma cylindrosporum TaxID=76867 RepID=A0A0C3CDM1_HEBCY|nr:hypothetical protein M413DRAFT_27285 [Hebeloma cylindrosporum h7]
MFPSSDKVKENEIRFDPPPMVSFNSSNKGKEKEIRLDPPPMDDYGDHTPGTIDVSDGESYNSGFGSGYSEAGALDDTASLFDYNAHGFGSSAEGLLDDRGSVFDEEVAHGASSDSNHSHHSTPAGTSTRPRVRFSLRPAMKSFSRLRKAPPGAATGPTSSKAMCVICKKQPSYNDGHRTFPTCGNTCAAKLEAARNIEFSSRNKNQVHYPKRSGKSSTHIVNGHHHANSKANVIRMCEVCRVRPRFQKNGKIFPTCGLTCAAKLQRPGSVEMCELCKKRPRVVINGHKFPHCGRKCRDKAKAGDTAVLTTSTTPEFASYQCKGLADRRAPFLLEVPRGHVAFKEVADLFSASWRYSRSPCPAVKKVYMVVLKPSFGAKYDFYRSKVSHSLFKRKGNEKRVWLGMTRTCGLGNSGNTVPCKSVKCVLCSLVRSSVSQEIAQGGIQTSSSLAKAVELSNRARKGGGLKVVLLANVLFGREIEKGMHELVLPLPPQGFNSVHLVERRLVGGKVDHGESLVFDGDAIKPLYLISY